MRHIIISLAFLFTISASAEVLVKINKKEISVREFENRYRQNAKLLPGKAPSKKDVLKNVIYFELALQEAKKLKLDKDADLQQQYNILLYQTVVKKKIQPKIDALKISEKDVRQYYADNPLVRTNHIVFLSKADMSKGEIRDLKARATKVQKEAAAGKGKFEDLARKHSEGPSARTGGDVDWGARHKLLPEYYEAALKLKNIGDVSGVVETPYGFHVIQLKGRRPYSKVDKSYKSFIIRTLKERKGQNVYAQYFEGLRKSAKVSVNDKLLK